MPTILAAWIMHIPIFLQEQNSMPGITNRVCAHFARKIFAAFDNVKNILGTKKTILTGNPITLTPQVDVETCYKYFGLTKNKLVLLIMGGSLGAKSIIDFTSSHAQLFEEKGINVILSLGKNNIPPNNQSPNIKIIQYIERMDYAYTIADIVISRAGAMSISELCAYKKASILIPYPNALNDHQTINAMTLVEHNAAILVKESDMESSLINALSFAIKNRNSLEENISKMSKPNATVEIVKYIKQYVNA
jgi:UDP-N-acetylglucosamine--N-acetylmuramyl-(pentapeptide) pyrophosphoryl-undecaprenol N-acetylglucosamine transferase